MAQRSLEIILAAKYEGAAAFRAAEADLGRMEARADRLSKGQDARRWLEGTGADYAKPQDAAQLERSELAMRAAIAESRNQIEKTALAERLGMIGREAQAAWAAGQQQVAASLGVYQQRVALEDQLFAATHTRREVDLYNLQAYYARMRAMHQGNTRMLALIDQTYAAQRNAILGANAPLTMATLLARGGPLRAGTQLIASQAAFSVSPQMGMAHAMLGGAGASLGAMGGLAVGGILVGLAAVSRHMAEIREWKVLQTAIADQAHRYAKIMENLPDTTRMGGQARQLGEEAAKDLERSKEMRNAEGWEWFGTRYAKPLQGDFELRLASHNRDILLAERALAQAHAQEREQQQLFDDRRRMDDESGIEAARIAATMEGIQRRRAEFEHRQAQERRRAQEANQDKPGSIDLARLAEQQQWERLRLERDIQEDHDKGMTDLARRAEDARISMVRDGGQRERDEQAAQQRREIEDFKGTAAQLLEVRRAQTVEIQALDQRQTRDEQRRQIERMELNKSLAERVVDLTIATTTSGMRRQLAQLDEQYRRELEQVRAQGGETGLLGQAYGLQRRQLLDEWRDRRLDNPASIRGFEDRPAGFNRPYKDMPEPAATRTANGVATTNIKLAEAIGVLERIVTEIGRLDPQEAEL